MPYILDKLRSQYDAFRGLSDERLVTELYRDSDGSMPIQEFARQLGVEINKPGFTSGLKSGLAMYPVGVGQVLEDTNIAPGLGRAMREYGENVQLRNPIPSGFEAMAETPGTWFTSTVGQGLGSSIPALVPYVGPLSRALGVAGTAAAGTAISAVPSYGGIRADQREQGIDDPLRAAGAALAIGAVEQLGGVQRVLRPTSGRALGGILTKEAAEDLSSTWLRSGLRAARRVMMGEGAEEIAQSPLEQIGAYRDPTSAESIKDTLYSGVSGVVGALPFGGVTGVRRGLQHSAARSFSDANRDNLDAPLINQLDALAIQREFIRRGQVEGVDPRSADAWYDSMAEAAVQGRMAPVKPSLEMEPDLLERARREQYPPNLPEMMQGPQVGPATLARGSEIPRLEYTPDDGPIIMGGPAPQVDPNQGLPRLNPQWPAGAQGEMFRPNSGSMGGIPVMPTFADYSQPEEDAPAPEVDTRTGDLFAATPSAMVPTMFNPGSAPANTPLAQTAGPRRTANLGAVASNIRSQIAQMIGKTDAYSTKLAFGLAQNLNSLPALQNYVDEESVALSKALTKLDKMVSEGSNMLDPDEYAKRREAIEDRRLALEAAKELVGQYQSAQTRAFAEEAQPSAQPGRTVGQAPENTRTAENTMRDASLREAVSDIDARARDRQSAATKAERMRILRRVLAEPTRRSPLSRFRTALREAGFVNMDVSAEEQQEIARLSQRRDDVRAATKTPPGLAAARGKLTPRASLDTAEPAAQTQQVEPITPPAQAQPAQAQPAQAQQAEPDTEADEEQLKEVGVDDAADIKYLDKNAREADTAKTQAQLNRALDRIFSMYMDTDSKAVRDHADKLLKDGFSANDLEMARRRYKDQLERVFRSDAVNPETFVGKRMRSSDAMTSHSALEWIASNGSSPGFKQLALRIKSVIPDFPINYISTTDNLPDWLAEEMNLSNGVFVLTRSTGKLEVWVWEDRVTEGLLLHELLHAGTAQGIDADSQFSDRLTDIGRTIANAITGVGGERSGLDVEARRFFGTQMRRPHELLAFAFTSPMMQQALQRMDANGKWLDNKPVEARLPMPKQTLWGRLVDAVRGFLNLPKVYEKELARVLAHNARVAKQEMESQPITTLLGRLLDEALARNTAARAQSREDSAGAREVGNQRVSASEGQTDTPQFRRWFGESKVVDASGNPLVVYHGTNGDIQEFDPERLGENTNAPSAEEGFFFSSEPAVANEYVKPTREGERFSASALKYPLDTLMDFDGKTYSANFTYPDGTQAAIEVTIDGNTAVLYDGDNAFDRWQWKEREFQGENENDVREQVNRYVARVYRETMGQGGGNVMPVFLSLQKPLVYDFKGKMRSVQYSELLAYAKQAGHDGAIFKNTYDSGRVNRIKSDIYVAFSPAQIKSAVGNNGEFNPNDRSISRSAARTEAAEVETPVAETDREAPRAFIEKARKTPLGYAIRSILGGWRTQPGRLGFLTLDQLKDRFSQFPMVRAAVDKWLQMGQLATALMRGPSHWHREWAAIARKDRPTSNRLNNLFIQATLAEMWVDGSVSPEQDERNKHLDFKDEEIKATAEKLRSLYMSLPENARAVYTNITRELNDQFRLKQAALLKRTIDVYRDELKDVFTDEDLAQIAEGGEEAWNSLAADMRPGITQRQYNSLQQFVAALQTTYVPRSMVPGPYFPLQRRGDYVTVYKSKSFGELERALERAREDLNELMEIEGEPDEALNAQIDEARKAVGKALKDLEQAKGRPEDYVVEFFQWMPQAQDRADELRRKYGDTGAVSVDPRKNFNTRADAVPAGFLSKLSAQLNKSLPDAMRRDVENAVRQLVIRSMPERSAFKSEIRRMRVAGASPEDAMHSFVTTAHRNAWTISRLENITELTDALNQAVASRNNDERIVGNELMERYGKTLEYNPGNALIDFASNASYMTHLGFSIGYWVQNATQPWMVSMPIMAGTHGFARTNKALADASVQVVKAMANKATVQSAVDNLDMQMDMTQFNEEERRLIDMMTKDGRIDITIRADLGVGSTTATNPVTHIAQRAAELSSYPAHMVEMVNRVATALAAYRLQRGKGSSFEESAAYADKIVVQTHVDYSAENAPRFMNPNAMGGLGRLAFQFRRYQQAMVYLWGKTLVDAVRAGKLRDNPDAKALVYLTAVNFAMAGASGLPIAAPLGLVMWALSQIGEEDEERDLIEVMNAGIRDVLGEKAGDVIRRGIPATIGWDLSAKLGSGDILSPVRNLPSGRTGQEWAGAWALQLFGAAGGMVSNWADALMIASDNPVGAIQKILPAGAKNALAAVAREYNGVTDRRGNAILMADELGGEDFAVKVLGLGESVDVTRMYDQRRAVSEAEQKRTDVRNRLMREYSKARIDGDELVDVREEIDAFNQRNPEYRIKPADLVAHHRRELDRRRELNGGVRVNRRNADIAEEFGVR